MKPATVAKKLGIYLPATPQEFQDSTITREEFAELQANPPEWLAELRRNDHQRTLRRGAPHHRRIASIAYDGDECDERECRMAGTLHSDASTYWPAALTPSADGRG